MAFVGHLETLQPTTPTFDAWVDLHTGSTSNYGEVGTIAGSHDALGVWAYLRTTDGTANTRCVLRNATTGAHITSSANVVVNSATGAWYYYPLSGTYSETEVAWFIYSDNDAQLGIARRTTATLGDIKKHTYANNEIYDTPTYAISTWADNVHNLFSYYEYDLTVTNTPATGLPTISGIATAGVTLTADTSGIADADGINSFTYSWLRDDVAISGATASTYTLTTEDIGAVIKVSVSLLDNGGTTEGPLVSTGTSPVAHAVFSHTATIGPETGKDYVAVTSTSVDTASLTPAVQIGSQLYADTKSGAVTLNADGSISSTPSQTIFVEQHDGSEWYAPQLETTLSQYLDSDAFSVRLDPQAGYSVTKLVSIDSNSFLSDPQYNANAGGDANNVGADDVIRYKNTTNEGGYQVVVSDTGLLSLVGADQEANNQTFDWNYFDAQDGYAVSGSQTHTIYSPVNTSDDVIPVISLVGGASIDINEGGTYSDVLGTTVTASDNVDGDISNSITVTGSVDGNTVGTYTLTYNVTDAAGNAATTVTRTVRVVDITLPVITLIGSSTVTHQQGTTYTDSGATAVDANDGNLTSSIITTGTLFDSNTVGSYVIRYNVSDGEGNQALEVTRTVNVTDQTAPVITLINGSPFTINVGNTFSDPGVTATDNNDGNLTSSIVTTGSVDVNTIGTYTLNYSVTDAAGNIGTATRTVNVVSEVATVDFIQPKYLMLITEANNFRSSESTLNIPSGTYTFINDGTYIPEAPNKDPSSTIDYGVYWGDWLAADDSITASEWIIEGGLVSVSESNSETNTSVMTTGGISGVQSTATNRITTSAGRIEERSMLILCENR